MTGIVPARPQKIDAGSIIVLATWNNKGIDWRHSRHVTRQCVPLNTSPSAPLRLHVVAGTMCARVVRDAISFSRFYHLGRLTFFMSENCNVPWTFIALLLWLCNVSSRKRKGIQKRSKPNSAAFAFVLRDNRITGRIDGHRAPPALYVQDVV